MSERNMSERSMSYKNNGKDSASLRKSRIDEVLSLRKEKREENMAKRRNMNSELDMVFEHDERENEASKSPTIFDEILASAKSSDIDVQIKAISQARKLVSSCINPPIDALISSGLLPVLVCCLQTESETLQYEAAWTLTNVASGTPDQTHAVVSAGAIPHFVHLLSSSNMEICDQAIWALSNIIGESPEFCDICINLGIIQAITNLVQLGVPVTLLRTIAWILTNLFRNEQNSPSKKVIDQLSPVLFKLIQHEDPEILRDAMWALYYMAKTEDECIQKIIDIGIVPYLVQLFTHKNVQIPAAVIRIIGEISYRTNSQVQAILDCGVLENLFPLLMHTDTNIVKTAVWILSNVVASDAHQRQAVVSSGLIPTVIHLLEKGDFVVQKEAAYLTANMVILGDSEQVLYLVQNGVLKALCSLLGIDSVDIVQLALKSLFNILKRLPDHVKEITRNIEELGGLDKIEKLQDHENRVIYQFAYDIVREFYDGDDENPPSNNSAFECLQKNNAPFNHFQF